MKKNLYGIIGFPLGHSFSPKYFTEKFRHLDISACYEAFPLTDLNQFPQLIKKHPHLVGLNVTTPYKESIIPYLDELDGVAAEIAAVNTIQIKEGRLKGFNTDVIGFKNSLERHVQSHHQRALVLGSGGASKAVLYVLQQLQLPAQIVSRRSSHGAISYQDLTKEIIAQHHLIINTTPLGTWPDLSQCPDIPYEGIGSQHLLFDLIYNPTQTLFLKQAVERGAATCNGYQMLVAQAEAAWKIWQS